MCVKRDACVFEFVLTRQSTELLFERLQDHLCDSNRTVFWFDDDTVMKLRGKTVSIGDEFVCWTDVSYTYDDNMRKAKIVFYDECEESLVIDVSVRVGLNVDVYMSEEKRDDVMSRRKI